MGGGGGNQSFTLINRGGQKSVNTEKGGVISQIAKKKTLKMTFPTI